MTGTWRGSTKAMGALVVGATMALLVWGGVAWACSVNASFTLSPGYGPPGTHVVVDGTGFFSGATVDIHWGDKNGPILATTTGPGFHVSIVVPTTTAGYYIVTAHDPASGFGGARQFQVTGPPGSNTGTTTPGSNTGTTTPGSTGTTPPPRSSVTGPAPNVPGGGNNPVNLLSPAQTGGNGGLAGAQVQGLPSAKGGAPGASNTATTVGGTAPQSGPANVNANIAGAPLGGTGGLWKGLTASNARNAHPNIGSGGRSLADASGSATGTLPIGVGMMVLSLIALVTVTGVALVTRRRAEARD